MCELDRVSKNLEVSKRKNPRHHFRPPSNASPPKDMAGWLVLVLGLPSPGDESDAHAQWVPKQSVR